MSRNISFGVILFVFVLICDINISWCEEQSSLAFVIDDTESMGEDRDKVIDGADRIMDLVLDKKSSLIQEMVLVTFNDPAVKLRTVTRDRNLFKEHLKSISARGGGDCPEKALTGIETALNKCRPGSYVYVFTDDGANDDDPVRRVNRIRTICQEKQIQVVFIITPNQFCGRPETKNFDYYNQIATGTSGQVFRLSRKSEVEELLKYVEVTITGKKTVDMSKTFPKNVWSTFNFSIDDQTQYAIVSASGQNVQLELLSGPTTKFNKTVWIDNVKIITLDEAGPYSIRVKGSVDTSVVVFKRTDFSFQHGFSETLTNTIEGTSKQSTTDTKSHLLVYVDDISGSISIKNAVIYDMAENVIDRFPLHHISKDFYATNLFIPPQSTFKIAVEAVTSAGKVIRRISKTPITPKIKQKVPQVVIEEGDASHTVHVSYGSSLHLTCVVNAYPPPTITWYFGRNHELTPEVVMPYTTVIKEPYTRRSILYVTNAMESQQFSCKAENLVGKGEQSVYVGVRSPFLNTNTKRRAEVTQVKYGDEKEIFCDIQTNFPNDISIAWYRNSRLTDNITPSAEYTITTNNEGSRLRIKHASERDMGSFYCFAWLKNNRDINTQLEIPVRVTGIEAPKIDERTISRNVLVNENVNIPCRLLTGVPKPSIMWLFKRQNTNEFVRLNTNDSDQLKLDHVGLENAGQYKCIAINFRGQDDRVVMDLNVYVKPMINRALSNETHILENHTIEFNCRADTGTPPPSMVWFYKKQGSDVYLPLLKGNALRIDKTNRSNSGHYKCVATNAAGSDEHIVQLFVEEIPEIEKQMRTVDKLEHSSVKIPCKVTKGIPKPRILWQFKSKSSSTYGRTLESDLLTINNLNPGQTGLYRCLAENSHGKDEYIIELNVHVKPIIDKQITKLTKREGTDVEIRCNVLRGIPKPEVNWYFKAHGDKDFQSFGSEEVLKINQVSLGNSGQYKCTANNIDGHDEHTIEIVVEAPPRITNNVTSYDAMVNDTVLRIPCNVVGYPLPSIVWMNMEVEPNPIINDASIDIDGATLVIKSLTKTSESSFICKATNALGTDEKIFNVSVISDINDFNDIRKLYILMGSSPRINCSVPHNDSDMVRWFKNGELVGTGSVFDIINAKIMDDGNYTCRVSNSTGSVNGPAIEVNVGWRPEFDDEETNATIVWEGNQQSLSCAHSSRFTSEITWLHNGEIIEVSKNADIMINDLGNYTCRVNNPHETLEKHFQVISKTCLINRLNEISSNVPLILNENSKLAALQTRNSFISVEPKAQMKLSCLNSNTFQNFPGQTDLTAVCESEDKFLVDGKIHTFTDLHCNRRVAFETLSTKDNCFDNNDSEMIRVGFNGKDFIDVFEACLDTNRNVTLYTKVDMVNPNYGNMENSFSSSDLEYIIYGKTDQSMAGLCQFVNAIDTAYGPAQLTTFVPFNEMPCLSKWEKEGWNKIEDRVRYIVSNPEVSTVTVWSGTSKLLSNRNGNTIRYFWKVVKNHNTRETLAIVHIDGENPNKYDVVCNNDCEYDWLPFLQFPTFCCVLDAFVTVFEIPKHIFL